MRIKDLQLYNFKFFTNEDNTLHLDGKNVLIWGENGSGKSSIYWAIYTILQCSFKDGKGIDDYFTKNDDKNLLNIHKADEDNAYVKMTLDNGKRYNIELGDHTIIDDEDIQLSTISSDFIDYNVIGVMLRFWHKDDPVLFQIFYESIFRYLKFAAPKPYKFEFFDRAWDELSKEIEKDSSTSRYPNKQSVAVKNKTKLQDEFNIQLKTLLANTTSRANDLLQNWFGYDIEIELEYREYKFEIHSRNTDVRYQYPEIFLKIRKYYGKEDVVKKPHSFLNEAKKTAIGLAIRLGLLERRLLEDDRLNLIGLDDLLISLDMSNREAVFNLLLNQYQKNYQLIFFTHDKSLFQAAKQHLFSFYKEEAEAEGKTSDSEIEGLMLDNWIVYEMYQGTNSLGYSSPYITEDKSAIQKAHYYFKKEVDFNACGNNLRTALEEFFREFLPYGYFRDSNGNPLALKDKSLGKLLIKAQSYFDYVGFDKAPLIRLDRYISRSLNPLSHFNPKTNFYRKELVEIFGIYNWLTHLSNKPILEVDEFLAFDVKTTDNTTYTYTVQLLDPIRGYCIDKNSKPFLLEKDKRGYGLKGCTEQDKTECFPDSRTRNKTLKELYDFTLDAVRKHKKKEPVVESDMTTVFKIINGTTLKELII